MQLATAHVLTGLFALSHRFALSPADLEFLNSWGSTFTPSVWRETRETLKLADTGGAGTELDLGFMSGIFVWLGVRDEAEFVERYGVCIADALARDRGSLSAAAAALEGDRSSPLALPLSHAWSARASRLMDELPESGGAVLLTLERAIDGCPWDPEWIRPLFEAIVQVADLIGNAQRSAGARKILDRIEREAAPLERTPLPLGVVTQILTALFCVTHPGFLLEEERALDPGIDPSQDTWTSIVTAAREGRIEDIPAPVRLLRAWGAPDDLEEEAVRDCLRRCASLLPAVVAEVERLWGGTDGEDVSEDVARTVVSMAVIRYQQLHAGFQPLPGERERNSIFYEEHQGVRRRETLELAALIRGMWPVILGGENDLLAVAAVHRHRAGEKQALGAHEDTRSHLAEVMHWTSRYEGSEQHRREYGAVCVAQHLWLAGEPEEAMRRLRELDLEGKPARELLQSIEDRGEEREALLEAQDEHNLQGTVHSLRLLALAHMDAGHTVRLDIVLRDFCQAHPDNGLALGVHALLLFELGRFRDSAELARRAVSLGPADTLGRAILARSLGRIGPDGRDEATEVAVAVLQAEDVLTVVPSDVLVEVLDVAHYGGAIGLTRRVDDFLWAYQGKSECEPSCEWLGAAVARRCHVWADDAPEWLARLADSGMDAPAEFARWVVDRVEGLLWWRSLIERQIQVLAQERPDDSGPGCMDDARRQARTEAVGAALRAAISLGYAEADLDEGYEGSGADIEPAVGWEPSLKTIASCFGDALSIRLFATAQAQAVWFGLGDVGASELLVLLATIDNERVDWIRWAGEHEALADVDAISGLTPATKARLQMVLELAEVEDEEDIREAGWVTRWQEGEGR